MMRLRPSRTAASSVAASALLAAMVHLASLVTGFENWNVGEPRGKLTLYGSMAQDFRGPVGTGYWGDDEFVVVTEEGLLHALSRVAPGKRFVNLAPEMICPNMKLTKLQDIRDALVNMEPVITVAEDIRVKAKQALDRMLAVPRD